jgi:integrase
MLAGLQLKKLAPRTIRGVRAVLRAALGDAMRWNLVHRNAAALAYAPRVSPSEMTALSADQAKVLVDALSGDRLASLFTVLLTSGLRSGEALGLRWSDVDRDNKTLQVRQALQRFGKKLHFVEPKSKRSRRTVKLPLIAVEALDRQCAAQRQDQAIAGIRWVDSGLVFTSTIGTPLDERNVRRAFKAVLKSADLPPMRVHDLRHSAATILLEQGVHPRVVMETLGHSQITLTLDTYSHVTSRVTDEAATRMDEALGWIGCQNGCQTAEQPPSESETSPNSGEKVVSRLGIEPRTRRLREREESVRPLSPGRFL